MICPLKFNNKTTDADGSTRNETCQCEKDPCAWWNEYFGKCSIAVDGFLKGIVEQQRERRKDG